MTHVLRVPDKELVATAGIDALAFIRVCQFGIQLFVPISLVVVIVFIPVHVSGDDLARQKNEFIAQGGSTESLRSGLNSRIMRTTLRLHLLGHRSLFHVASPPPHANVRAPTPAVPHHRG